MSEPIENENTESKPLEEPKKTKEPKSKEPKNTKSVLREYMESKHVFGLSVFHWFHISGFVEIGRILIRKIKAKRKQALEENKKQSPTLPYT